MRSVHHTCNEFKNRSDAASRQQECGRRTTGEQFENAVAGLLAVAGIDLGHRWV